MAYKKDDIKKIFNSICEKIESGKPVRQILKEPNTPSTQIFFKWLEKDKAKAKRYARACEERADQIFEDMINIADNQEDDIIYLPNGLEVTNHNVINRSKIRIDTRKWILSKMQPKKYGDKVAVDNTSSDGSMSPKPNIIVNSEKTAKEIDKLLSDDK